MLDNIIKKLNENPDFVVRKININNCDVTFLFFETLEKSVQWLKNAFPADFLNYSRTADTNKKNKLMSVLQQKNENLLKDLKRLTNV